ncbi:MAG TPA: carboxylesterase/lipase family protein [Candidatus Binataceae bacterium]|nr:carboxylesterase/lipase family protein [Candidatus Binataceae bacterium]
MDTIVTTSCGKLEGEEQKGLFLFKGVPFARPPVDGLRWLPPQPPQPWSGIRSARNFASVAPQNSTSVDPDVDLVLNHPGPQSEDCLYLNVWSPGLDRARRPVMVWIHGGGFERGSSSNPLYSGENLARRGDVVVVTIAYRLGTLGFLRLIEATEGRIAATGNEALLDQIAALQWVRDNIEQFGGDPGNVTVFGESAGAMSIGTLMAMPAARGLFHKAILQSGACHTVVSAERAARVGEWLVAKLAATRARDLRQVPAAELLRLTQGGLMAARELGLSGSMFAPVVDGELVARPPIESVAKGEARAVATLVGTTLEEIKFFAGRDQVKVESLDDLTARLSKAFPAPIAKSLVETYRTARAQRGDSVESFELYSAIGTDRWFRIPAIRLAQAQSELQGRAFSYLFTWKSVAAGGRFGACHTIEIPFVFGAVRAPGSDRYLGVGAAVDKLAAQTQDGWLAFARRGDPSCEAIGTWSAYDGARRATMILGPQVELALAPMEPERAAWDAVSDALLGQRS